jgi:hypothetical protein
LSEIRRQALSGAKPSDVLLYLFNSVDRKWEGHIPRVEIDYCLVKAFNIPLSIVRGIEPWSGFNDGGSFSDQEVDLLLTPWFNQFVEQANP